jgi:Rho-binding antiterminator
MINCDQHDYIELVCMHRYPVKLTTKSNDIIQGTAVDTGRNEQGDECIKLNAEGSENLVVLSELKKLEVTEDNPHVSVVNF